MKKILLLIACFACTLTLRAQDEAIFTHYQMFPVLINPAAAGFNDAYQLQMNARAQWTGFPDAPQTIGAQFNGPLTKGFAIGVGVLSETAAQQNRLRAHLNYAFRFNINENVRMAAGFSTEFQQMRLDNLATDNNFFQPGDRIIDNNLEGIKIFDASVGVFSMFQEKTFVGVTFANLIRARLDDMGGTVNQPSALEYYTFLAGHRFEIVDLNFTLEPSIMARKIKDTPGQMDINLRAGFLEEQLVAGLSYRTLGALGILLGAKLSNFAMYYSYDVSFQRFQQYNSGSHEISIGLTFQKKDREFSRYND